MAVNFLTLRSAVVNDIAVQSLRYSTLVGSTIAASVLTGSTVFGSSVTLSSLNASQITVSTLTGSTLFGSTMVLSTLNASQITVSTLTGSTLSGSTMVLSSLNASQITVSTLTGSTLFGSTMVMSTMTASGLALSTLTVSTINGALPGSSLGSTMISIGASTNAIYNNFTNGSYASWATPKSNMSGATKTVMSATGQYQLIVANATSGLFLSSDSGITWTSLTGGLPTLTGAAYWCDGVISANGQYITLSIYNGGSLWMSSDYGRTFALTNQPTPDIWLPLNGNVNDRMGLSAVTTPGTVPGYVTVNRPAYTAKAVHLINTAGSTASQYIRGTWTGASNFTISGWFNAQTVNGTQQMIYSAYQNQFVLLITTANQLQAFTPSGGAGSGIVIGTTSFTVSVNTWYYFTTTYQTGGICSFYVNNTLIGTTTNVGGTGTLTSTQFSLGTYDVSLASAFNGYISDFEITNSVFTYAPIPHLAPNYWIPFDTYPFVDLGSNGITSQSPAIYLPFDGNVLDSIGGPTPITSSSSYVTGKVGSAINLANTAGVPPAQYVQGTWPGAPNFTISFWMNPRTLNGTNQLVFSAYDGFLVIGIDESNQLYASCPTFLQGNKYVIRIGTTGTLTVNTWYFVTVIFQTNGLCSFYVDDVLIGTNTNTGGAGFNTHYMFSGNNSGNNNFNGYIDDFRIYNYAITYVPMAPITITGSIRNEPGVVGQYAVNLVNTAGSTATTYITNTWSGATNFTVSFWCNTQSLGANQLIFGSYSTLLDIFINTSNQLTLYLPSSTTTNVLAITGPTISSNTWYQVTAIFQTGGICSLFVNGTLYGPYTHSGILPTCTQFCLGTYGNNNFTNAFNGFIDDFRIYNAAIPYHTLVPQNYKSLALSGTGQYALASALSGWVVGSSDASKTWSKQAVIISSQAPFTSSLSINHTGQCQMVATGPAAGSIMPNQSGLAWATWFQGGVDWIVSASSYLTSFDPYSIFNNTAGTSSGGRWVTSGATYTTAGNSSGISNTIFGISAQTGDWLQIQSYVPLVMFSYQFATGFATNRLPKTYYIVGSNDGSTWYPIQYVSGGTVPSTAAYTIVPGIIVVNRTSVQTFGSNSTVTTTSYSSSTNAYLYFRLITLSNYSSTVDYIDIGEWRINFQNSVSYSTNYGSTWLNTSQTVSNESVAMSPSGQYVLSTNSMTPFARLTLNETANDSQWNLTEVSGAGLVEYSDTIVKVGTHSVFFNNEAGGSSGLTYLNYTLPFILSTPTTITMSYWVYPTSFNAGVNATAVIFNNNASIAGLEIWFGGATGTISCAYATTTNTTKSSFVTLYNATLNAWNHIAVTYTPGSLNVYWNGILIGNTSLPTGSLCLVGGGNMTNMYIGCGLATANGYKGYVDDVRIYTSALNADEVNGLFKNPAITQTIAVSNSYLPITSYTEPVLPGITANVVDTAVSQTGQYMVAVTSDITNNVYYSTDFGTTFTAITLGTNMMTSCSISYDGSYLTVENDTTVYTLNRNTQGFSVAVGNQAGQFNQSLNSIAIGNQAGQMNQSANSIILNATGSALNTTSAGLYVAPIADIASSLSASVSLLGYGTDGQVIRTGLNVINSSGNVGISGNVGFGTTAANAPLQFANTGVNRKIVLWEDINNEHQYYGFGINPNILRYQVSSTSANHVFYAATSATTSNELMRITGGGNVGIGTNAPIAGYALHVVGKIYASSDIYSLGDITAFSDQRYKQNIVRLDRSLDAIRSLSGYSYTREDYRPGEKHIGLLAQEVLTVFPEAVSYDSTNDKYSVNYNCLIAPVVEAIKELYDRSEAQAEIIKSQQSVIESQGKTIQSLLARFDTQ